METLPEVTAAISRFGEQRLGKGIVLCKDTPNFIANRLGFGAGTFALDYILEHGYTVEEVDEITGPLIGRPKSATFRLVDLVGVDVWQHVMRNLGPAIPHDEYALRYLKSERVNRLIEALVQRGWLGNKSRRGFYQAVPTPEGGKEFWPLDLQKLEYHAPRAVHFASIERVTGIEDLGERLKLLLVAGDRGRPACACAGLSKPDVCLYAHPGDR